MNPLKVALTGQIGESTPLFSQQVHGIKEIILDMSKVTYISSIGVKAWIMWTVRIPANCVVQMLDVPYVIVSQASMTLGFVNKKMKIESFQAPYLCADCGFEETKSLKRGVHFEYPVKPQPKWLKLPEQGTCAKCRKTTVEPDFLIEKTFKFLDME